MCSAWKIFDSSYLPSNMISEWGLKNKSGITPTYEASSLSAESPDLSINWKLCYVVRHINIHKLSKNINVAVFNENCDIKTSRKRSYDRNSRIENHPTNAQKMHLIAYASRKKYSIITVLILYYFPFTFFREKNLSRNQGSNILSS